MYNYFVTNVGEISPFLHENRQNVEQLPACLVNREKGDGIDFGQTGLQVHNCIAHAK